MSTRFQELLAELNTAGESQEALAKSMAAAPDDKQVAAAAAEAGALTPEEQEAAEAAAAAKEGAGKEGAGKEGGEGATPFTKSMKDENGDDLEVIDPEAFMKSVQETMGEQLAQVAGPLLALVKKQGDMLKSMHEQMTALGGQGRGRKAVIAAVDRPAAGAGGNGGGEDLTKSQGMNVDEFFAKANSAFEAKRITGQELTTIDVSRRMGQPIDHALIRKVIAAGA